MAEDAGELVAHVRQDDAELRGDLEKNKNYTVKTKMISNRKQTNELARSTLAIRNKRLKLSENPR